MRAPLFPGDSEIDELCVCDRAILLSAQVPHLPVRSSQLPQNAHSCRLLGTPDEDTWPGVSNLPDFKPTFPQWRATGKAFKESQYSSHPGAEDLIRVRVAFDGAALTGAANAAVRPRQARVRQSGAAARVRCDDCVDTLTLVRYFTGSQ